MSSNLAGFVRFAGETGGSTRGVQNPAVSALGTAIGSEKGDLYTAKLTREGGTRWAT